MKGRIKTYDISRLDVILELLNLLLQLGETNLVILDNQVNLQFLDTETNSDKLGSTPDETLLLDATDGCLELLHVGLIIYHKSQQTELYRS